MPTAPAEYWPDVKPAEEFVGPPTDPEDERIEVGVVIVGGGPAGGACAVRLMQLLEEDPALAESLGEVPVALVEKGKTTGSHLMSGAMMDPGPFRKLFPDLPEEDWPTFGTVAKDSAYLLTRKHALPLVPVPPPFRNHGNHVVSIAQLGRFLGGKAEEMGVYVLPETAATKLLVDDGQVVGVRTGDKGRGREGQELGNFEPGSDLIGKATVLAEGTAGHLAGAAIGHFEMGSDEPQNWEIGVKEIWEVPKPLDRVIHTMNWPYRMSAKYSEFGGSFIYPMGEDKVCVGLVAGLDYADATFSIHDVLQEFKTHPLIHKIIEGGKRVAWGAKTLPSGGYWAMPEKLSAPGMVIAGDSAGMANVAKLKGIHMAMEAGILAAEAIFEALKKGDTADLSGYDDRVRSSEIEKELYIARNKRQPFTRGFLVGGAIANAMEISGGRFPGGRWKLHDDADKQVFIGRRNKTYPKPDGKYTFDKLSSVFATANASRDDAPSHIRVQENVPLELGLMWQYMCPAQVYEVPEEILDEAPDGDYTKLDGSRLIDLKVNPSNCVQCGAITAKGGRLTPPEGGEGPNYQTT